MIKIIEDGKRKDLWDMPQNFIKVVAELDNYLEGFGAKIDSITITTNERNRKDCHINWKCDLRYLFF